MPESWGDVPPGVPAHHHCVVSVEGAHHPKHWVDAAAVEPHFVAWTAEDAVGWVRDQMIKHRDGASERFDLETIDVTIEAFDDPAVPGEIPGLWVRLRRSLALGRWAVETYQLQSREKLVMQILVYADAGQPSGTYAVCNRHRRKQ